MNKEELINKTVAFVKESLADIESGHDWWHTYRVWQLAKRIAESESVDLFVVELGALLHDVADSKFYDGDETVGPRKAREFLGSLDVDVDMIDKVVKIIENISFRGTMHEQQLKTPELDVVQDADRLDAIGAIGIARVFAVGAYFKRPIHDPEVAAKPDMTAEEYKKRNTTSINHFYEKLLLLKDKMNTGTGKKMAALRHEFMEEYLKEFYAEWAGSK